jgi:nucleotide-binding universal stress UspA family protein
MAERVLVPLDGSEQSWTALDHALAEFEDAEIGLINVVDPIEAGYSSEATAVGYAEEWFEQAKGNAEELFDDARERTDREFHTTVEVGRPARTIVDYAEEEGYDQIVMGSHGRSGVSRILLGSVAETVVRRSPVPVTVVR